MRRCRVIVITSLEVAQVIFIVTASCVVPRVGNRSPFVTDNMALFVVDLLFTLFSIPFDKVK